MRHRILLLFAFAAAAFSQTGGITGTVVDESGRPIEGASVTASLWSSARPVPFASGRPPAFMPVAAKALSSAKGEFQVDGLVAGKYHVCIEKREDAILNPCLWADPPASVDVTEGKTTGGISVVAAKGVTLKVRVQDAKGLLRANPAADDVRIGTSHRVTPFIPGVISGKDPAGRTVSVIVPRGQPASISVSSSAFVLADDKGAALANKAIPLSSDAVDKAGTTPVVTIHVRDSKTGQGNH